MCLCLQKEVSNFVSRVTRIISICFNCNKLKHAKKPGIGPRESPADECRDNGFLVITLGQHFRHALHEIWRLSGLQTNFYLLTIIVRSWNPPEKIIEFWMIHARISSVITRKVSSKPPALTYGSGRSRKTAPASKQVCICRGRMADARTVHANVISLLGTKL